jgi:hypothetical protein
MNSRVAMSGSHSEAFGTRPVLLLGRLLRLNLVRARTRFAIGYSTLPPGQGAINVRGESRTEMRIGEKIHGR